MQDQFPEDRLSEAEDVIAELSQLAKIKLIVDVAHIGFGFIDLLEGNIARHRLVL